MFHALASKQAVEKFRKEIHKKISLFEKEISIPGN